MRDGEAPDSIERKGSRISKALSGVCAFVLLGLSACGNPFGKISSSDPNFDPGLPAPDVDIPTDPPTLVASTQSFADPSSLVQYRPHDSAPVISLVAGLSADHDRRVGKGPEGVTPSDDNFFAISPDPLESACGVSCQVGELFSGVLSLIVTEGD